MNFSKFGIRGILTAILIFALTLAFAAWYFDFPHSGSENVPQLHGKTERKLISRLGEPTYQHAFAMSEASGEFRVELFNTYPPESPNHSEIMIKEYTWKYSRYRLTVWLHRVEGNWVVLDTCRYQNDVRF